jgi:hypothetical protein
MISIFALTGAIIASHMTRALVPLRPLGVVRRDRAGARAWRGEGDGGRARERWRLCAARGCAGWKEVLT